MEHSFLRLCSVIESSVMWCYLMVDGRFVRWGFVENDLRFEASVRAAMVADDMDSSVGEKITL